MIVKLLTEHHLESKLKRRLQGLIRVYTCQNATLLEISSTSSYFFVWLKGFCKKYLLKNTTKNKLEASISMSLWVKVSQNAANIITRSIPLKKKEKKTSL